MKKAIIALLFLAAPVFAADEPQKGDKIDPAVLQGQMTSLQQQLARANAEIAMGSGQINRMNVDLEAAKKAAAECSPKK